MIMSVITAYLCAPHSSLNRVRFSNLDLARWSGGMRMGGVESTCESLNDEAACPFRRTRARAHTHTHTHTYTHTHTLNHTHTHTHTHILSHTHTHTRARARAHAHAHQKAMVMTHRSSLVSTSESLLMMSMPSEILPKIVCLPAPPRSVCVCVCVCVVARSYSFAIDGPAQEQCCGE
jgi:hypothetical protein